MRLSVALLAIACLLVVGCGGNKLVGKWQDQRSGVMALEFTADGKLKMSLNGALMGTSPYKVKGDKLTINGGKSGAPEMTSPYTISGDILTVDTGFGSMPFKRVK